MARIPLGTRRNESDMRPDCEPSQPRWRRTNEPKTKRPSRIARLAAGNALSLIDRSNDPGLHLPFGNNRYREHAREARTEISRGESRNLVVGGRIWRSKVTQQPGWSDPCLVR